jgi:putative tricarboxylic transport membrane protein
MIQNPRDFWSGVIFILIGLVALYIGQDYAMGSAGRMGPAYFPNILAGLLTLIGTIAVVRSLMTTGASIGSLSVKGTLLVAISPVLFALMIRGAGLVFSIVVLVMLSAVASIKFRVAPFLAVAIGLAVFCALVFVQGLGLPMLMVGPWLSL